MTCKRCGDSGRALTGAAASRAQAGAKIEAQLARIDRRQREFDEDATGQDQEAFDG